jgi:hypothetical protein
MKSHNGTHRTYTRINIYLDDAALKTRLKIAAARRGITISALCVKAIETLLSEEDVNSADTTRARAAAAELDRLREQIGPIGVPVSDLIAEGRRR